jgi:lipid-binding SYLF domain-containing protein
MNSLLKALCLAFVAAFALVAEPRDGAAGASSIDADANETLHSFVRQVPGAKELATKAAGILVFPNVVKAGIGIGGEYGEGILLNQKQVQGYYNLISASFRFQLGVQARSIIMFAAEDADGFRRRAGWKIGVDGR